MSTTRTAQDLIRPNTNASAITNTDSLGLGRRPVPGVNLQFSQVGPRQSLQGVTGNSGLVSSRKQGAGNLKTLTAAA